MGNAERNEDTLFSQLETTDKEGTYEQKKGDQGNKTIYNGTQGKIKTKKKQLENIIYTD